MKIKTPIENKTPLDSNFNDLLKPILAEATDLMNNGIINKMNKTVFDESIAGFAQYLLRDKYKQKFGFATPNETFQSVAQTLFKGEKIIELGAGSGFLSYLMQSVNLDVTPIDINTKTNKYGFKETFTPIIETDGIEYIKNNHCDTVLLSWPDYNSTFAYNVAKAMKKGQKLFYIGEEWGGCTGDEKFFEILESDFQKIIPMSEKIESCFNNWPGINDTATIYIKIK